MKRIFLVASLCLVVGSSFAQKKALKEAKSAIKMADDAATAVTNAATARELIKPALINPETANDAEAWKIAGDIEYNLFDNQRTIEMQKAFTKKEPDEEAMYTGLYNMYNPYLKADSLGQIPDVKGKVKNKVRKDIVKKFISSYRIYMNAGIFYNNKHDYVKAADFFERYWELPSLNIFGGNTKWANTPDSTFETIKYYAIVCSIQAKNTNRSISLLKKLISEPYVKNSAFKESDPYELLATEYQQANDTINYIATLRDGAEKFPVNNYFAPNLINEYIRSGKTNVAIDYINKAIAKNPQNFCELQGVKGSLYANEKNYEEAATAYNLALQKDANCERALEGLGVLNILHAQDIKDLANKTTNKKQLAALDKQTVDLYQNALVSLLKYKDVLSARKAANSDIKMALQKIQNVYYNLSLLHVDKSKEFNDINEQLKNF